MKSLLYLLALLPIVLGHHSGTHVTSSRYPFSTTLYDRNGDTYILHWNFNTTERTIAFAVNVSTTGWVGFGISPNGGMTNSDVVIGWVSNGQTYFHDRYAERQALPPIDPSQDWFLVAGEETGGYTILEFTRNWTTCDDRDRDIRPDTARVVFSWNDIDPTETDGSDAIRHQIRGSASINLLGGLRNTPPDPSDTRSFTVRVNNVEIPSVDTTYWCAATEIPQEVQQRQQYVIRYSPLIGGGNFDYVHHMLVYLCGGLNETAVNDSAPCFGTAGATLSECLNGELIAGWAVGGVDFVYPENVAYPMGGPGSARFLVIEIHYNNPDLQRGVIDNSGVEFFYTSTPRQHDAGILTLGHVVNRLMIVPPNAGSYSILGECPTDCTTRYFPPSGVNIFANLLHTHTVGRSLTLQLIRRNQQCNVLEAMAPVDMNLQYDFDYQQFTYLPNEVRVFPGDILLLNCTYATQGVRTGVTLGGQSTREEMCLTFPVYYPRSRMSSCISSVRPEAFLPFLASEHVTSEQRDQIGLASQGSTQQFQEALDQVSWTPEAIQGMQQAVLSGSQFISCAANDSRFATQRQVEDNPNVVCDYRATDSCNPGNIPIPCCQRPEVVGGSGVMVVSSLFLMAVMSIATLLL